MSRVDSKRGRKLVIWGCSDTVRQGQPLIIDFSKFDPARPEMSGIKVPASHVGALPRPPAPARNRTYAMWPLDRNNITVPSESSLLGDHYVHGNYPPEIRFSIGSGYDYMAPVVFSSVAGGLADAINFEWNGVPDRLFCNGDWRR